jgi:hypothetical protein
MATTRSCPACGRPNGLRARHCLYCAAELPSLEADTPANTESLSEEEQAKRAGELLAGLSPAARALMPPDVLEKLESASNSSISQSPNPTSETRSPLIEELNTGDLEPLQGIHTLDDILPTDEVSPADADSQAPPIPASPTFENPDEALRYGLCRGGGPFGPREASIRFILLPDSRYIRQLDAMKQAIHETLGIDLYTATQALQKEIPSYLGSASDTAVAELLAKPLWSLGVRLLMLQRERWLEGTEVERVVRLHIDDPRHLSFEREDGSHLQIARGSIRWAALGEIRPDDIPPSIREKRSSEGAGPQLSTASGSYQLLDLLRRGDRRPIRIRSDRFDFSFLGEELNLSADLNLRRLLSHLTRDPSNRELVVPLDENFRKVPHLPGGSIGQPQTTSSVINRRELEFTEYVLLLDARHHF